MTKARKLELARAARHALMQYQHSMTPRVAEHITQRMNLDVDSYRADLLHTAHTALLALLSAEPEA